MTRKHFEAVADILRKQPPTPEVEQIIRDLARFFKTDNPRFKREKFLDRAGL